ncbi:pyridoxine 5'-phosphate synthase [Wolbachia endosymbiont of Dirofilaria (Dirofilaria) immitis]|uniref:pyridoxine 5'-phosphate synthase n=1 Tax=Wolbachia endosymbiont of Dirofilaria (Dirofilaria) immitis TaxID=1812115 RepID=UPI00158C5322|nr:pyridoxine 5'-phosphate synthase [Wolbachia endosymbiont of Dirofilaria (Dirofilaria) immitis]QKX02140.1 pyridoxine 5'-phosphate synthase [Wolbachia endosymbiont of Dirofilaria (Dirofilaria) immitis]
MKLGVNIDHVATLRNVRGTSYPDLLKAAEIAIDAGADFITVHLREDRRHIKDEDVFNLKKNIKTELNLEIAATEEMLEIAKKVKPYSINIVPEKREELTTEGGLNIINMYNKLSSIIKEMHSTGIKVSLFINPSINQLKYLEKLEKKPDIIEIHTGDYCDNSSEEKLQLITHAAEYINKLKIECHAGHGITCTHAKRIKEIPHILALNIGHFLISEAIFYSLHSTVKTMKMIISN